MSNEEVEAWQNLLYMGSLLCMLYPIRALGEAIGKALVTVYLGKKS